MADLRSGKDPYPGAVDPRVFMNGTPPNNVREVIKEVIVLRSVVTKCRHQLPWPGPSLHRMRVLHKSS